MARFLASGIYQSGEVLPTISPSMDIQVASNFERLLLDLLGGDGPAVRAWMKHFAADGRASVDDAALAIARALFTGHKVDEAATSATMAAVLQATGELVDPHTAVGLAANALTAQPTTHTPKMADRDLQCI